MNRLVELGLPAPAIGPRPLPDVTESYLESWVPHVRGPEGYCPIVVLCDAPTHEAFDAGLPLHTKHANWFGKICKNHGFVHGDLKLVSLCTPIAQHDANSDSRQKAHVDKFADKVRQAIADLNPRVVITFGKLATSVMLGRPSKIMKLRGIPIIEEGRSIIFPMTSPGFVRRIPDHIPSFNADMGTLARMKAANFDPTLFVPRDGRYEWVDHLPTWIAMHGGREGFGEAKVMSVDTETQGGTRWWSRDVTLLSVQVSWKEGHALVVPVCDDWCGHPEKAGNYEDNRRELKRILENPDIRKISHNLKFEMMQCRKIGIEIQGWLHDTQLLLFNADENLPDKSLDNGVKVFVPTMSGYADELSQNFDKSNMAAIPKDVFIRYSGGDADATLRLARAVKPLVSADLRQQNCYRRVQMPGIMSFANTVEPHGMLVNTEKLSEFSRTLQRDVSQLYESLIARVPAHIKQRHLDDPNHKGKHAHKVLSFTRDKFTRDILFGPDGFALKARVYTKSTAELPDPGDRLPSVSGKKHLPYFTNDKRIIRGTDSTVGDFVADLIQWGKGDKLLSTYVGHPERQVQNGKGETVTELASGIWQYLSNSNRVHPSFMLHRTNTGRTASNDPNGQNFPTRGNWAKQYKEIFEAAPGWVLVSCDLSQIELRLVAWMSMDPEMLRIYNEGGDIHTMTASRVLGVSYEEMLSWKGDGRLLANHVNEIKGAGDYLSKLSPEKQAKATIGDYFAQKRFGAKAINFGFIYGMQAHTFQTYAKTDYGIDYMIEECRAIRDNFFKTYWALPKWHAVMHEFARKHGYVRALHGSVRHLHNIYSEDQAIRALAERQAVNAPIQRLGSDLGIIAQARFCHQAPTDIIKVNGFIHDALYMEVREDKAREAASALKWCMETPPIGPWFGLEAPLPILSEAEIGGKEVKVDAVKPDWWEDDEEAVRARYLAQNRSGMIQQMIA